VVTPKGHLVHLHSLSRSRHQAVRFLPAWRLVLPLLALAGLVPSTLLAATLHGQVTDPDARAVPGARVLLSAGTSLAATATTDASGGFRIERLPAGRYELLVALEGFRCDPVIIDLGADDDRAVSVQLRLSAVSESVVVTASQVELPLSRASDTVTVITSAELRARQFDNLADALRFVPGISIVRNGGRGGITSLFPRGGDSDYTLVLVDGIKANAFGGGYDFSDLAIHDVDRIEIVRGPESALFGSDAIGAVVQILTRHGGPPELSGLLETGGELTRRLAATSSGSFGAWSFGASAQQISSAGYTGIAPATGERVANDDSLFRNVSASAGWHTPGGPDFRIDALAASDDRGFPGPYGSNPIGAYPGVDRLSRGATTTTQLGARIAFPLSRSERPARQLFQLGYMNSNDDFKSLYGLSQSGTRRWSARAQTDITISHPVGLSIGVEAQRERATSTYVTGTAASPIPIHRLIVGSFAEARCQVADRLSAAAGVRAEYIRRDQLEASPNPFSPRPPFGTDTVVSVNPRLSAAYVLRGAEEGSGPASGPRGLSRTRLRAAAGTGIRPPDAIEIAFTDNPHLRPERSRSAEVGIEQGFAGDSGHVELTAFVNHYDDLIIAVGPAFADASRYRTDNISNAGASGIEGAGAYRTSWGLDARATYTFLRSQILAVDGEPELAPAPFKVGDPLLRRPRHQASLDLVFAKSRVTAFAQVGARGRVLDVEPTLGTYGGLFINAGYTVANAGVSVRLTRSLEILSRVNNLFDRRYEEALGFPSPGRLATVGVRVALGR
jgi:outer membrane cobalamin receptor